MYITMYSLAAVRPASQVMQSNMTRMGALSVLRASPSCSMCQGHRTSKAWWKTPSRTFSHCLRSRTTVELGHLSKFANASAMNIYKSATPLTWCRGLGGASVILQGKTTRPLHSPTRSFGVDVSTGPGREGGDSIYVPTPTEKCYELLEHLHDSVGLPWWLTIMATTIFFRGVIVFPFALWQQLIFARIENAQPLINAYVEQVKQQLAIIAKEKGWSKRKMSKVFTKEVRLVVSNIHFQQQCSSHKLAYLPIWQTGVWLSMTMSIGQMTGMHPDLFSAELDVDVLPSLANEGLLWFSDLMQTDIALAVLLGLVNITLVELWSLRRGPLTQTQNFFQNGFRVAAVCSIPVAAMMPAAVTFYWLVSSMCGLGQLALLRIPLVRRRLGIPHTPSEMKRPMEEIRTALKARYAKKVV